MRPAESFPAEEYEHRRARVRAAMADRDVGVLMVTAPEDVYYLSGLNNQGHFVFTALVLAARSSTPTLVAREMEGPTAAAQAPSCEFAGYGDAVDPADVVAEVIRGLHPGRGSVGYQPESLSLPVALWHRVDDRLSVPAWVDCADLLNDVRAIRSDAEVACLREAARLSDIGMDAGVEAASGDGTGGELVGAIEQAMMSSGSDYPGFVPLVRSVEQIRLEHVAWTERRLAATDSLFLELSAAVARYHSPLARTVRPSGDRAADAAADLACEGMEAIRTALCPGRTADEVYRSWKETVEAGLGRPYERHHCGYLVGIGFPPSWMAGRVDSLRPGNRMPLRTGMTFHVQSWIVDDRLGTYAISDTALVTEECAELLTRTPHRLRSGTMDRG